jgi:hypothetical protein
MAPFETNLTMSRVFSELGFGPYGVETTRDLYGTVTATDRRKGSFSIALTRH